MSVTSAPASAAPSAYARAKPGLLGRMSWPTTMEAPSAPVSCTNALPVARASASSSWSGTVPRTSYALKIALRLDGSRVADMALSLSFGVGDPGGQGGVREHERHVCDETHTFRLLVEV